MMGCELSASHREYGGLERPRYLEYRGERGAERLTDLGRIIAHHRRPLKLHLHLIGALWVAGSQSLCVVWK